MSAGMLGADPEALRGYAGWCEQVAAAADELASALRDMVKERCPIWGPLGEQLGGDVMTYDVAWLNYGAQRLRTLARTVSVNADQQEVASGTKAPEQPPSGGSGWDTVIGVLQLVGGGVEVVSGGLLLIAPEPTMLSKVAGGTLVVHGADTFWAGWRTLWHGKAQESYTFQGATAAAEWVGVPEDKARWVGVGVDVGAGLGPGLATRFAQRATIAAARAEAEIAAEAGVIARTTGASLDEATDAARAAYQAEHGESAVHVAYEAGEGTRGLVYGHNVVGVTTKDGATKFYHLFELRDGVRWFPEFSRDVATLQADGYQVATVAVKAAEADAALRRALTLGHSVNGEPWGYLGPNCATTVKEVVEAAGQSIPHVGPLTPRSMYEIFKYPGAAAGDAGLAAGQIATPARVATGAVDRD